MQKYLGTTKSPNPFTWGTPAHTEFEAECHLVPMKIVVSDEGQVYYKVEKSNVPQGSSSNRTSGGKWVKAHRALKDPVRRARWLADHFAVEANFKGGPKCVL